jgi:hypothetical protein
MEPLNQLEVCKSILSQCQVATSQPPIFRRLGKLAKQLASAGLIASCALSELITVVDVTKGKVVLDVVAACLN